MISWAQFIHPLGWLQQGTTFTLTSDGRLFEGTYQFQTAPENWWVQVASFPGTNGTKVYQVQVKPKVNVPLDDYFWVYALIFVICIIIWRNKIPGLKK